MLPVSDRFLSALRGSHAIAVRARVITPGATGADPAGTELRVIGGGVVLDGSADVRGTVDLEVAAAWPQSTTVADLVPYGTEIAVSRGVLFGNGDVERAPLGIYRVTAVEQSDAAAGYLRITGQDRMGGIVEARLEASLQYPIGAINTYGEIVADLVQAVYPTAVIEWDDAATRDSVPGRVGIAEEDRYAFLNDLITGVGKVWYWDYRGVLVINTPADPTVPVWSVDAGANGVLVSVSRARSRDGVYNAAVVTGEAMDDIPPVTAVARDEDPSSVTYWGGPFGKVPTFFNSSLITTQAQAETAAAALLARSVGLPYAVDFTSIPNPALEPLDVVELTFPPVQGQEPAISVETHVVDRVNIPLEAGQAMPCGTRLTVVT